MIRVLVVDDHNLVRDGVIAVLQRSGDIEVVGSCTDGQQAVDRTETNLPDVILMDLSMPGLDGVEATRQIVARDPSARIVILTAGLPGRRVEQARAVGAVDCVFKDAETAELLAVVRRVGRSPQLGGDFPL